ncbi:MAG: VapE domain-containing protein, partial [Bacillota bacterium]
MLIHDRQITISAAGSRKATRWPVQKLYWSELVQRLQVPARSTEVLAEYLSLPKPRQDDLKDVGGFVAGEIRGGGRRKETNILGRDVLTLDLDNIPPGQTQNTLRRVDALGCAYAVYSTRKHEEARPRLRVLVPVNRTATADEYEPAARKLGSIIGIELCDPTTFQVHRLMYWPSCSSDSTYVYQYGDKPFLDLDGLLATYTDWRNVAEWPEVPGAQQARVKLAARQEDPTVKAGVVGAFCKTYDIYRAIDTFLFGIYTPCDNNPGRYTFTGGSTTGGAIIYDNGAFLYSHHATDPAGGRLVNSFDLVRLHRFTELDEDAKPDTPTNKLPSYTAMCQLAISDTSVAALLNQERYEKATQDFARAPDDNANWMAKLAVSATTGAPAKTIENVCIMLKYDPKLAGRIRMDLFSEHIVSTAPLPWRPKENGDFIWQNKDDDALRRYTERVLNFHSKDIVSTALAAHANEHGFNPLKDYLLGLEWDGVPRLDTLYVDYLGAEDCGYIRAVTRKGFTAAVARVMQPGCKFDCMTVINGRQGIYKTTLFEKMGGKWFSNSLWTLEGKEALESIQGRWIIEIAELTAYRKSGINAIRQFLSKTSDYFRKSYGHRAEEFPRRCVFFGTTNDQEYLNDPTGNRRFWPVEAEVQKPTKSVPLDLDDERDQLWAEAVMRWRLGETLYLPSEMEEEVKRRHEKHVERDPLQGQIEIFLSRPIPEDWQKWSFDRRQMFWSGGIAGDIKLVPRDRVCPAEIWKECLNERKLMTKADAARINAILQILPGWEKTNLIRFGSVYGSQR